MCLYLLFFALLQKTVPAIFCMTWLKKTTTVKYKRKYTKTTQCYPEKIGNSIKWNVLEVYIYKKKVRKGYLKRRQVSTTKCATLPQSICTSFLEYKVMQILYNKLTQAHLPTTTAKTNNSQMYHIKIHFHFFSSFFLATISHITQKKSISKNFWVATFLVSWEQYTSCVHNIRLPVWASETYTLYYRVFKSYKYIGTKIY